MHRLFRPWLQCSRLVSSSLLGAAALLGPVVPAHAASDFTPLAGTWIVTAEQDGKPGRGMAVDIQDGTLVMQVYNYQANGSPTFHLAVGTMNDNQVVAPLKSYKGGRYFGSGPLSGTEDSNAGNVEINFTSASTATIRFPGEQPVPMQRFRFESLPAATIMPAYWLLSLLDGTGTAVRSAIGITIPSSDTNTFAMVMEDNTQAQALCTYSVALEGFNCTGENNASPPQTVKLQTKRVLNQISGSVQIGAAQYRMVGKRLATADGDEATRFSTESPPAPSNGTWIVTSEKDGKPGRGMAIDVQTGTLVMQVYNYKADGNATFHLAVGSFGGGQASAHLKSYQGGRYFGSGPQSGTEASDAGEVFLEFISPTKGYIRFPGESAVAIERYQFAPQAPDLASLLGTWSFGDSTNKETSHIKLTTVDGDYATGSGVRCRFLDATTGLVRCTESFTISGRGTVNTKDYRFIVHNDMAFGKALTAGGLERVGEVPDDSTTQSNSLSALRIEDRHGVKLGVGGPF